MAGTIFLGFDLSKVNWYYVFYVLFSLVLIIGAVNKLLPMGMERAVIVAIGFSLVLYFYSQRWFGDKGSSKKGIWPPHINTCPDYLTYIPPGNKINKGGCVDTLGVSSNGGFTKLNMNKLNDSSPIHADNIFKYTSATVTDVKLACNECQLRGLTWEGIWDGETCGSSKYSSNIAPSNETCSV